MREQNASATVYEMKDGEWKVIATSAAAIRDTVQRIIGLPIAKEKSTRVKRSGSANHCG